MYKTYVVLGIWVGSLIGVIWSAQSSNYPSVTLFAAVLILDTYGIFRNTLNVVQYVGRLYWIIRDTAEAGTPRLARGFMRQVTSPWLIGSGVQVRVRRWVVQVGVCRKQSATDYTEGLLMALDGRLMDEEPKEIGAWR